MMVSRNSGGSSVTSGIYERGFDLDGVRYHHLLSTETGWPVQNELAAVTIFSESSMEGDALSTAAFVLGLEEGQKLINSLDQNEWNRHYYESTIAAWEAWQAGDKMALHHVGTDVVPLLIPAKEMCRSAFLLDEAEWNYVDKFGCTMLASADTVDVHQVLLYRGHFFRFARYQFGGLCRVHSDHGWVDYQVDDGGVPGMIYKTDKGEIHSRMYVLVDEFTAYQKGLDAMQSDQRIDYNRISEDLFVK